MIFAIFSAILCLYLFRLYAKTSDSLSKLQKHSETSINQEDLDLELQKLQTKLAAQYELDLKNEIQSHQKLSEHELTNYRLSYENRLAQGENELKTRYQSLAEIELERLKLNYQKTQQQDEAETRKRILELQESIDRKEEALGVKLEKLEVDKENLRELKSKLEEQNSIVKGKINEYDQKLSEQGQVLISELEKVAGLTRSEAIIEIKTETEKELGEEMLSWQQKYLANFEEIAYDKAREITSLAIQRCSSEVANELTITAIKVENEADKGKLIGKQGRNIQWLEKTLGVELIIDDTPGVITISGFSSIRRHIAKRTIERLLEDGRIHPSSIEEMYENSKSEIASEIADAGQWAVNELGIFDFPPQLIRLLGRLSFRTGYGQNILRHSVEMAKLAGLLADGLNAEFPSKNGIDRMVCVKGALLHDIGKAVDEEMNPKGNHVEIGEKVCDMYALGIKVKKCISSHHTTGGDRESYYDSTSGTVCLEAAIVDACDTLSGGRPGARKETAEAYFQRMEALENVANTVNGVLKSYVMRAGKEIWIFFDANLLSPSQMHRTTRKIARDINNTVKTPFEIKVIGFREDRVVEYTR